MNEHELTMDVAFKGVSLNDNFWRFETDMSLEFDLWRALTFGMSSSFKKKSSFKMFSKQNCQ
jgi:hypothetical protein